MHKKPDVHLFALYYASLSDTYRQMHANATLELTNRDLTHRISKVLRLQKGEQLILFDRTHHLHATLEDVQAKQIVLRTKPLLANTQPQPIITLGLPLLKRRDLEEALYAATEVGINAIQLLQTEKSSHLHKGDPLSRLERIVSAAAEQAKQFALPTLYAPIPVAEWFTTVSSEAAVLFEPDGEMLHTIADQLRATQPHHITLLLGPEGDLTPEEKQMARSQGFIFCALTPTILQAHRAVAVGCGAMRSLLRN